MILELPDKIKRNSYIRIYATKVKDWNEFSDALLCIFGVRPTEDNTVGQYVQEKNIAKNGMCNGGINLWGMKIRPILAKIAQMKVDKCWFEIKRS